MPYGQMPGSNTSYLDPNANAQRNNITQALMNVQQPPPATPQMPLPTGTPTAAPAAPPAPMAPGMTGLPPTPAPGAPPAGAPLPMAQPQAYPLSPGVPPMRPPGQ